MEKESSVAIIDHLMELDAPRMNIKKEHLLTDQEGYYGLALKKNHGDLLDNVEKIFNKIENHAYYENMNLDDYAKKDVNHIGLEYRSHWTTNEIE